MKLLFDFRSYQISKYRGVGRYILSLAESIVDIEDVELSVLYSSELAPMDLNKTFLNKVTTYCYENFSNYKIDGKFDFFIKGNFFEKTKDISYIFPLQVLTVCKDIVGINYDLIPLIFAGDYLCNAIKIEQYLSWLTYLNYASHIFCISECTKKDSIKYLHRPSTDFTTIYGGADSKKFKSKNSDKEYNSQERTNNIVFIAGADKRKNYHGATRAFAQAYETGQLPNDAKLYLICNVNNSFIKDVEKELKNYKAKIGEQVIITGFISDEDVVNLLSNARASIFASFYEGLGLPILESYIAGTPCFASNLSSTKEFINEESGFNPYNNEEFTNIIIKIYKDEDFLKQSLNYGRSIVKNFNWNNSATIMIQKLKELKSVNKQREQSEKIAVFTILPPETSGIAPYSYKLFTIEQEKYDVFSNISSEFNYKNLLLGEQVKNIYPLDMFEYFNFKVHYKQKLFVLGNSYHHKEILKTAINTQKDNNRCLYLHEAFILDAFFALFNYKFEDCKKFIKYWYPEANNEITNFADLYKTANEKIIFGIRPLINLTGIRHIIVNNETCKNLIKQELSENEFAKLKIEVLFHPVEKYLNIKHINLKDTNSQVVIGSFGAPNYRKMTDKIIEAVKLLNTKFPKKFKLVLAGYLVRDFLNKNKLDYDFIQAFNAPKDEDLLAIMNSVDLSIQLRADLHGETSGCICQLLGLKQKVLTNKGFVSEEYAKYCAEIIDNNITTKDLANKIEWLISKDLKLDFEKVIRDFSYESLSQKIYSNLKNENDSK